MPIDEVKVVWSRGAMAWWSPAPAVLCSRVEGHMTTVVPTTLIDAFVRVRDDAGGARVKTFHDWQRATGYDSDARQLYTSLSQPLMNDIDTIDALVQHRLLAMGIEVARIALGTALRATTDRAEFERRLNGAISATR